MDSLINLSILTVFIPTFFFVSATPGMCMTLSMTMGMSIGLRRTFWMMSGELLGVGIVAASAVIGVAAMMLEYPAIFNIFKYIGGSYLFYLGVQMWLVKGKMAVSMATDTKMGTSGFGLATQGFITAIANPKGWAFFISLLPPFISDKYPLIPQMTMLLIVILIIEFLCLILYAGGGSTLKRFLQKKESLNLISRIAGTLMMGVGVWLAFG